MRPFVVAIAMLWAALAGGAAGKGMNAAHAAPVPAAITLMSGSLVGVFTRSTYISKWDGRPISREALARVW